MTDEKNFDLTALENLAKTMGPMSQQTTPQGGNAKYKTKPGEKFDIYKVDYPWIDGCDDKRECRLAWQALTEDGGFPDLANYCKAKLKKLDPKFKLPEDFNKFTPEEEKAANKDVLSFLSDMENADKKLKRERDENGGEIFPDSSKENKNANNSFASDVHRKRKAEEDRLKGNEFMKAKEYQEAIDCYTKSLDIFEEAATFGNRAMANLRLKRYGQDIEDSTNALRIDPTYIKAHHRRGKAYLATKKYELAIKDF